MKPMGQDTKISCRRWGRLSDGRQVDCFYMEHEEIGISILTYGAIIQSIRVKDKAGQMQDVVTGFDTAREYERSRLHFGATIGRCCNRIRNGRFSMNGTHYQLSINSPPNHIHGGVCGLDRKIWDAAQDGNRLLLTCRSTDGEEGYPGNLVVNMGLTVERNSVRIRYTAQTDADTLCNLTNHTYFNLNGHGTGTAVKHGIEIPARLYAPLDANGLPVGIIEEVRGTQYDMNRMRAVAADGRLPVPRSACFLPDGEGLRPHAWLIGEKSGISLRMSSSMPALQYYTGYLIPEGTMGKQGAVYGPCQGICLEPQFVPDAVNCNCFSKPVLQKGRIYSQETYYVFDNGLEEQE